MPDWQVRLSRTGIWVRGGGTGAPMAAPGGKINKNAISNTSKATRFNNMVINSKDFTFLRFEKRIFSNLRKVSFLFFAYVLNIEP